MRPLGRHRHPLRTEASTSLEQNAPNPLHSPAKSVHRKSVTAPTSDPGAFDKRISTLPHRSLTTNTLNSQQSFSARPSSSASTSVSTPLQEEIFPSSREADRRKTLTEILSRSHSTQPSASTLPSAVAPQIPPDHILIKNSELDNLRAQRDLFYESQLRSVLDWSTLLGQQKAHWETELSAIQALVKANNAQYEALKTRFVHVQNQMLALEGLEKRGLRNEEVSVAGFPPLGDRFEGLVESVVDGGLDAIRGKVKELYEQVGEMKIHGENGSGNVSAGSVA